MELQRLNFGLFQICIYKPNPNRKVVSTMLWIWQSSPTITKHWQLTTCYCFWSVFVCFFVFSHPAGQSDLACISAAEHHEYVGASAADFKKIIKAKQSRMYRI